MIRFFLSETEVDNSSVYVFSRAVGDVQTEFELRYSNFESSISFVEEAAIVDNTLNNAVGRLLETTL